MLQELEDVVGSGWSLPLISSMAECWETKAPVSTLSSSFFPSFLAPKRNRPVIPWHVSTDTSVGVWMWRDCVVVCSGMKMVMVCFIPDLDQALQGRCGWRNRDASLLLGLFPAAAVLKLCKVPFCLLWGKPACVDPFGKEQAELATDACCKKGFACSMLQSQHQSTGIVAPVISRAEGLRAARALLGEDSLHPGEFSHLHPLVRPTQCESWWQAEGHRAV